MTRVAPMIKRLFPVLGEAGVTAIEYGLIAALISIAAVATMTTVGTNLKAVFQSIASSL